MSEYNYTKRVEQRFPCGCHIDEMIDGSYLIVYCPKHKAAPELYEALIRVYAERLNIGRDKAFWTPGNLEIIEQALAKAEGKQDAHKTKE